MDLSEGSVDTVTKRAGPLRPFGETVRYVAGRRDRCLGLDVRRVLDFLTTTGNARPPHGPADRRGTRTAPSARNRERHDQPISRERAVPARCSPRTDGRRSGDPSQVSNVEKPPSGRMQPDARDSRPGGLQRQRAQEQNGLGQPGTRGTTRDTSLKPGEFDEIAVRSGVCGNVNKHGAWGRQTGWRPRTSQMRQGRSWRRSGLSVVRKENVATVWTPCLDGITRRLAAWSNETTDSRGLLATARWSGHP